MKNGPKRCVATALLTVLFVAVGPAQQPPASGERLSVDLALITTQEAFKGDGFPFIPYVDFAVFFGD